MTGCTKYKKGFTLIELLIVIAIIGIIAAIVLVALGAAQTKSRDGNRISQVQELSKALELYYTDAGGYPDDNSLTPVLLSAVTDLTDSAYLKRIPDDPHYAAADGYRYCVSADLSSYALFVNTEDDKGGTDYCVVGRGSAAYTASVCAEVALSDRCDSRF